MRIIALIAALLLTACAPDAPTAPDAATESAETAPAIPQNPDAEALAAEPATGAWIERTDEGVTSTGFGAPDSEYQFVVSCVMGSGAIHVTSSNELAPDQATTIRLITATQAIDLPAQSSNEGMPTISAEIADEGAKPLLIGMLGAPTDRIAVIAGGESTVFPWDESIARVLIACR